jgi:hypothetical protein
LAAPPGALPEILEPESCYGRRPQGKSAEGGMAMGRTLAFAVLMSGGLGGVAGPALAQSCTRAGVDVTCDDGRRGVLGGDYDRVGRRLALEPDLAASERHHRQQVVGRGRASVFTGHGKGVVPMENPSDPTRARCPVLDGLPYCY